ncbi:MAG: SDR family oxidoreductase [Phycisphaerales bacterium]|nr:SDR family oxidoreductase [Phycisphaerales bacterium]
MTPASQKKERQESIVITGTSRGIGLQLVEKYVNCGWRVFGCSRGPSEVKHKSYTHFELDVADEPAVVKMFGEVRKSGAPLYALLNNAGSASMNHVLTTPVATMEKLWRVNVLGTMICCREAAKQMVLRRRGRIVNFGSVAVVYALEGEAVYVATKAAVEAFTRVVARELGDYGVTVNAISPNPVKTDLIAGVPAAKMTALVNRQSIKRYGEFKDIMQALDYLLHPDTDFTTGQIIYLGGP